MSLHIDEIFKNRAERAAAEERGVDAELGLLSGEGAAQAVAGEDARIARITPEPWEGVSSATDSDTTYYGLPLLKPSVWTVDIPLYYFLGGAAGAALTLGAAVQLAAPSHRRELRRLSAICHWTGIIGSTVGAGFLVHDLGRPSRFIYMLRVFRPTSPMNMGSWILSGAAPSAIATGLFLNRGGFMGAIGEICGYISGLFGAALATYAGVLVSNTAIPVWQASRRWLPVLFAASSTATAGSIIDILYHREAGRNVGRIFGTAGRVMEIAATIQVERAACAIPQVGRPMRHGAPALLWKAATALTVSSLTLSLLPFKSRKKSVAAGLLGVAGSLCLRFAVHYIGDASARDPRAAFQQQRA